MSLHSSQKTHNWFQCLCISFLHFSLTRMSLLSPTDLLPLLPNFLHKGINRSCTPRIISLKSCQLLTPSHISENENYFLCLRMSDPWQGAGSLKLSYIHLDCRCKGSSQELHDSVSNKMIRKVDRMSRSLKRSILHKIFWAR